MTGVPERDIQPYRLYNLDVFEYVDDSTFGLYGAVPLLLAHRAGLTVGAFWCLSSARLLSSNSRSDDGCPSIQLASCLLLRLGCRTRPMA